ncbi:MAG: hypothetical protein AB1646_24710 [Thermodesulfobacteriota bacterium]
MKDRLNDRKESSLQTTEAPLFVLKYRRWPRAKLACYPLPFIYAIGIQIAAVPTESQWGLVEILLRLVSSYGVVLLIAVSGEMVLFREIRVYRNRIVKAWIGLGEREVAWAHASLYGYGIKESAIRLRWVCDGRIKIHPILNPGLGTSFLPPFRGVLYDEGLADRDDATRLNALLAELSGRTVAEFQPLCFKMDRFIQEENR